MLNGSSFEIKVQPSFTVANIKKYIETTQWYPADRQVLIHHGEVLKNETTLQENKVLEDDFILVMVLGKGKSNMCDFIEWKDDKCLAMFQEVAANICEFVENFKKMADDLEADLSEMHEKNQTLMGEKEDWARQKANLITEKENLIMEKESLQRELTRSTLLAETTCSTMEDRIRNDGYDKKMLYDFILCLLGLMVPILFGVVLKNK